MVLSCCLWCNYCTVHDSLWFLVVWMLAENVENKLIQEVKNASSDWNLKYADVYESRSNHASKIMYFLCFDICLLSRCWHLKYLMCIDIHVHAPFRVFTTEISHFVDIIYYYWHLISRWTKFWSRGGLIGLCSTVIVGELLQLQRRDIY